MSDWKPIVEFAGPDIVLVWVPNDPNTADFQSGVRGWMCLAYVDSSGKWINDADQEEISPTLYQLLPQAPDKGTP